MLHLHNVLGGIWFIDNNFALNYLPLISSYLKGEMPLSGHSRNALKEENITQDNGCLFASLNNDAYNISDYGCYSAPEDAPKNSVAVITISGAITKYDQECGPSGMLTKANILTRCFSNDNIKAVVLNIDSGGGEGMGCRLLQETINQRNKPVVAFANDFVASAAYGIAACCDKIIANSSVCRVGSIGTYMTIVNYAEYYKQHGIDLLEIYATKSTDKNQDYYEALKGNTAPLLSVCDTYNEYFIQSIASGREGVIDTDEKKWGTGKMFFAQEAMDLGLIDEIDSFENVLNYFNT